MHFEDTKTKRGCKLLHPESINNALAFNCSCVPQCADTWTRLAVTRARHHYLRLPLKEQLVTVYDILLSHRNLETKEIRLTIAGNYSFLKTDHL